MQKQKNIYSFRETLQKLISLISNFVLFSSKYIVIIILLNLQ